MYAIQDDEIEPPTVHFPARDAGWSRSLGRPLRVLVVDDTAPNRQMLQTFLQEQGVAVDVAEDGLKAIERVRAARPDIILMDVMMPRMDGYEATRHIKKLLRHRWVPVVFLSALERDEYLVAGIEAGGDDYIAKPISFVVLEAKLRSLTRTLVAFEQLGEHRRRSEAIAESMPDGFLLIGPDGVVLRANPAAAKMFGYGRAELCGMDVMRLLSESQRAACGSSGIGAAHLLQTVRKQLVGERADGTNFPMEITVGEIRSEGRPQYYALVRDISERQAAEQRLRDANELTQGIMAAAPYGLAAYDAKGDCVFANARYAEILGGTEGSLTPNFHAIEAWKDTGLLAAAEETLADWRARRLECRVTNAEGRTLWAACGFSVFRRQGEPHLLLTIADVSKRMEAELRLRDYNEALEQYRTEREKESALAKEILARQMHREGMMEPVLRHWMKPTAQFSGDVAAVARSSEDKLYVLLADATGHGLGAAISALPVVTMFYSLVEQCHPMGYIAMELNRHLLASVPTGHFVAAVLLCIDEIAGTAEIWQGGMPDVLLLDESGSVLWRLPSQHLPLGIVPFDEEASEMIRADVPPGCQFVLMSDGLLEASDVGNESFGAERVCGALSAVSAAQRLESVQSALAQHMGAQPAHDDISLLLVTMGPVAPAGPAASPAA